MEQSRDSRQEIFHELNLHREEFDKNDIYRDVSRLNNQNLFESLFSSFIRNHKFTPNIHQHIG